MPSSWARKTTSRRRPGQRLLDQADAKLVVAVAHEPSLTPGLFPGFIRATLFLALEAEAALELRGIRQNEAKPRFRDDDRRHAG